MSNCKGIKNKWIYYGWTFWLILQGYRFCQQTSHNWWLSNYRSIFPRKGRPPKLSIKDQILLCLSYWCEDPILFYVATSDGGSKPTTSRIILHVEDCLVKSTLFNLLKNLPQGEGIDWHVVLVGAIEISTQRPTKQKKS